jgi:predicted nucleic acid-binding protein
MILDTSGLLAAADSSAREHAECLGALSAATGPLLLSPFVAAELDYLITNYLGAAAALRWIDEVAAGAYQLEPFSATDVAGAATVMRRHADLAVGLADASVVILSELHGVGDVLTLYQRHFRTLTWDRGRPFRLLPADA